MNPCLTERAFASANVTERTRLVEHSGQLQDEIEREKRASQLRWSRQEKSIRAVIDNTIGMYGDLQGITNRALPNIKSLELDFGEELPK